MKKYEYAIGGGFEDCVAMNEMVEAMNGLAESGYEPIGNMCFVFVPFKESVNGYAGEFVVTQLMFKFIND